MKYVLLSISFLFIFKNGQSQTFGIKAGANLSKIQGLQNGQNIAPNQKIKIGYQLGLEYEYELNDLFSIESGLIFTSVGSFNIVPIGFTNNNKSKTNLMYLNVPINLKLYYYELNENRLFFTLGTYLGVAIIGFTDNEITGDKSSPYYIDYSQYGSIGGRKNIEFGAVGQPRRFDAGLGFGTGIELNPFQFGINYNLGLFNFYDKSSNYFVSAKNRVFSLSAKYNFGK